MNNLPRPHGMINIKKQQRVKKKKKKPPTRGKIRSERGRGKGFRDALHVTDDTRWKVCLGKQQQHKRLVSALRRHTGNPLTARNEWGEDAPGKHPTRPTSVCNLASDLIV
jgi:hypothetical protein